MAADHIICVIVTITLWLLFGNTSATKRLVLHGDDDVLQALSNLQTEVGTLTTKLQTEVGALTAKLQTQNDTLTAKFQTEISALNSKISSLSSALSSVTAFNIGSTYIRWGRTVCPGNGSELIYHGHMAGSKWNNEGGSSKSLCLPADPIWGKYVDGHQYDSLIRGTEIDLDPSASSILFGKNVNSQDVPCAVCRSPRSAHVMIPARTQCYSGWTKEYTGYIVSAHSSHKSPTDYACLDDSMEFLPHGAGDDNDHILNIVEAVCGTYGSLPCPPYVNGRELACVVCTK